MTLTKIVARWEDIITLQNGGIVRPSFVDLHTSYTCNNACNGCAYAGQHVGLYMEEEKHFRAVSDLIDFGAKAFDFAGGGEPTMMPYLSKLMRYIQGRQASYSLITNGTLITDELIYELAVGASYVRISLEASNEDLYCRYKGEVPSTWNKVLRSVADLVSIKKEHPDLEVSLKFSVGKSLRGEKHYRDAIAIAERLGVDRINFKSLRHKPEELSEEEKQIEANIIDNLSSSIPIYSWILPTQTIPQCWLNPLHTVMDWEGNLYICCYYYYRHEELMIGNILQTPLEELWMNAIHRKKIAAIRKEDCAIVDCKFFRHHSVVESMLKRGSVYFL
jgi:MoaA/NifB/PqqE/SkfB family radical SAM enzyme